MLFSRSEAWPGLRCSPHLGQARLLLLASPEPHAVAFGVFNNAAHGETPGL